MITTRATDLTSLLLVLACSHSSAVVVPASVSPSAAPAPVTDPAAPSPRDSGPGAAPAPAAEVPRQTPARAAASVAELPRARPVVSAGLDARSCTVNVGDALQPALNAAKGGDVLCLTRGATYRGNFVVPARRDTGFVVLRSAPAVTLGTGRMRPSTAAGLARLASGNTNSTLKFVARAARWHVLGVEITSDSALVQGPVALVEVGTGREQVRDDLPDGISFDRVYIHGWSHQHVRRAFSANGGAFTLTRSWCAEIHASGFDSQCVISWAGAGPMLIEDNHLAAASENLMFGGGDPRVPGLVTADVTIRRNHITKPLSWKGQHWNVKNLIETKSSARVLVEENVLDGTWTDGQTGYAFVMKSTTQGGTCKPCSTSDWTIRRNLIRHTGAGFSIAGRADQHATGVTDSTNRRLQISENWIEPLSVPPYPGDARPVLFLDGNQDVSFTRNVFEPSPRIREAILSDISGPNKEAVRNLTLSGNVFPRGEYGVGASAVGEGARAWRAGALGRSTWGRNAFIGATTIAYPPGTTWHSTLAQALGAAGLSRAAVDAGVAGVVVAP